MNNKNAVYYFIFIFISWLIACLRLDTKLKTIKNNKIKTIIGFLSLDIH